MLRKRRPKRKKKTIVQRLRYGMGDVSNPSLSCFRDLYDWLAQFEYSILAPEFMPFASPPWIFNKVKSKH